MSLHHKMLVSMLKYQSELNDVFDPEWRIVRRNYFRAAAVECAEMIGHHGYKWWKAHKYEHDQLLLEVVDVIHFWLSEILRTTDTMESAEKMIIELWDENSELIPFDGIQLNLNNMDKLEKMDLLVGLNAANRISFVVLRSLMKDLNFTFDSMYRLYAGKNVLNLFRQHNGDKKGTYIKEWSGREDNIYLSELMTTWHESEGMDVLYERLSDCYQQFAI